jgi:hypothetical protein
MFKYGFKQRNLFQIYQMLYRAFSMALVFSVGKHRSIVRMSILLMKLYIYIAFDNIKRYLPRKNNDKYLGKNMNVIK